jgi:uncharacterized membrane protein (UPF0182 family)
MAWFSAIGYLDVFWTVLAGKAARIVIFDAVILMCFATVAPRSKRRMCIT